MRRRLGAPAAVGAGAVAVAVAVAVVLASCGTPAPRGQQPGQPSEAAMAAVTPDERSRVFPPRPTGPADAGLRAFEETVASCMRAKGHPYQPTVDDPS